MSVQDLIAAAFNKDAVTFEETLKGLLNDRMDDAVEQYAESITFEEVDQIDEISGAKIGTYLIKARKSEADLDKKIDKEYDKDDFNTPENKAVRKGLSRKLNKRRWGQGKAMDKLTGSSFAKVPATEK